MSDYEIMKEQCKLLTKVWSKTTRIKKEDIEKKPNDWQQMYASRNVTLKTPQRIECSGVNIFLFLRNRGYAQRQFKFQIYERILKFKIQNSKYITSFSKNAWLHNRYLKKLYLTIPQYRNFTIYANFTS